MAALFCRNCRGTRATHTGDEGCWCKNCLKFDEPDRCRTWDPASAAKALRAEKVVAPVEPAAGPLLAVDPTARRKARAGSLGDLILKTIRESGDGLTCDDVERILKEPHQSASAAVNWLKNERWLVDSGRRRITQHGKPAIVWVEWDRPQSSLPGLPG